METISCALLGPISNKYIYKLQKAREMHRYHITAGPLLFFCYCGRSKFITKIYEDTNILGTQYFVQVHNRHLTQAF